MPVETIAGRYRVEREVGRGGMGSVWLCRDTVLDRTVAVKQVGLLPGESAPDLQRALREARSSAALSHRNVVSIYDAIEEDDHIWLVMEYVPGRTLSEMMSAEGPLPPARVAWIGAQVAEGLAAAHERGTVHRDVKPGNVLVTDGDDAKIADFGIARTTGDQTLTQTGMVFGTPAYFSPQLARGEEPTEADDVWALGATLYAAVEGEPPYPSQRNAIAMLSSIASGPPPRPERADFLAGPLERMLDPDPEARWSMAEVAQTLQRLHRSHDPRGTRESSAVGGTAVLPLSEPETAAATEPEPVLAPEPDTTPEPTPTPVATPAPAPAPPSGPGGSPDGRRGLLVVLGVLLVAAVVLGGFLLLRDTSDGDEPAAAGTSPSQDASRQADDQASEDTSDGGGDPAPSEEPTPSESESESESAGGGAQFVQDYYASLPGDPETAWSLLSPAFQDQVGSYDDYAGFWATIDDVTVDKAAEGDGGAVDVTLTYTTDGSSQSEVRRIELEQDGSGFLISGDQVIG